MRYVPECSIDAESENAPKLALACRVSFLCTNVNEE